MASEPVLPVDAGASRAYTTSHGEQLNPWAQEFIPLYTYSYNSKPSLPVYPPPPCCFLPPPMVDATITYNIYTAPHLQMNYFPQITQPPTPPSFWNQAFPIPVHFPTDTIAAQPSSTQLNVPVSLPPQKGFVAAPRSKDFQSRSLCLSSVPPELSEEELHRELKAWGPIRALHLRRKHQAEQALVIVDYYDLRHANQALADIKQRHIIQQQQRLVDNNDKGKEVAPQPSPSCWGLIGGKAVWAQYAKPTAKNQGTLVIFNLDATVSPESLRSIFEQYGAVKEVREPPFNSHIKFVEFFDVRDAFKAREALDEQEIGSKPVKIQFSHLGCRALREPDAYTHNRPPRHQHIGATHNNSVPPGQTSLGKAQASGRALGIEGHANSGGGGSFHEITGENVSQFAFDEAEALSNCSQARTTVMIKNIPNKYDLDMFLDLLDSHCVQCNKNMREAEEPSSAYDFVYLPIDFKNKCNLGYAFVNFTSAKATWKLYKDLHMHQWAIFNSKKICEVTYARLQGRRLLEDHFRNARLECDIDNYLPLVFEPPRSGQNFTVTRVIRGHCEAKNSSNKHRAENYDRVNSDRHFSHSWRGGTCKQTFYKVKGAAAAHHFNNQS